MSLLGNTRTSVSALLGEPVLDGMGRTFGHVREFAVLPLVDASRVEALVVRQSSAARGELPSMVLITTLRLTRAGQMQLVGPAPRQMAAGEDYLGLDRDLLDRQIIDVHGHKVVRVNDVDLVWETPSHEDANGARELTLRIAEVEVGLRGAVRRLLKGLPAGTVNRLACRLPASVIPWDFVDLIDRDPARRVRLKIEQDRLAKMHPSDLASILEELAPKEREALFSSLDEEVAAEALEEIDLKTQKTLIDSLDSEHAAGIVEEMDPGAAADLLSELTEERSDEILEEMNEKERHEVEELLEYDPDSAAGLMTSEYVALPASAAVSEVFAALAAYEGDRDTVTEIFVLDDEGHVVGLVPLSKLMLADRAAALRNVSTAHVVCAALGARGGKVAELFDKYNLRCLPVTDESKRMVGVLHAEHVIAWLRTRQ